MRLNWGSFRKSGTRKKLTLAKLLGWGLKGKADLAEKNWKREKQGTFQAENGLRHGE